MFRRHQNAVVAFILFSAFAVGGYLSVKPAFTGRGPAAAADWNKADFEHATLSVSTAEFKESRPRVGRSYFDLLFSNKARYEIPYPFSKVIEKIENYSGHKTNSPDSSGVKVVIIPMGRSLQRDAAVFGLNQAFSFDPFFRFPRIVLAVDGEPRIENSLLLNLKNKLYLGFNERAQILEAISYNDDEGRFEYQVVHDYAEGKIPRVTYANRTVCLGCHQNQSPIFSRGPWSETNANPEISELLKKNLGSVPFYFGAPLSVNESIPNRIDESTDQANLYHAYQKMWKELCTTPECKIAVIKNIILFRLGGTSGLIENAELKAALNLIDSGWQNRWPGGLSIPSPNIPDRNPLKDITPAGVTAKIPAEFEPLLPRLPLDIWKDSGRESNNTNRLIRGLAQDFTGTDIRMIDQWLYNRIVESPVLASLSANCSMDFQRKNIAITCSAMGSENFTLHALIEGNRSGDISDISLFSAAFGCDPAADQTEHNKYSGKSCPQMTDLKAHLIPTSPNTAVLKIASREGISLRTQHGYSIAEIRINLKDGQSEMNVYNQSALLDNVLAKNINELVRSASFSRFAVMNILTGAAQLNLLEVQNTDLYGLEMNVEGDELLPEFNPGLNGLKLMQNVCTKCHQNNSGFPANFMGPENVQFSDLMLCRRIEQCAPRMLYRLKMRNCDAKVAEKKKNSMPPEFFLANYKMNSSDWMKNHNAKILNYLDTLVNESELADELTRKGLTDSAASQAAADLVASACPAEDSAFYDKLPKCEFNQLKQTTRCH